MIHGMACLKEILEIIRIRAPFSGLAHAVHYWAVELWQRQSDIKTGSPGLVVAIIYSTPATGTIHITETVVDCIILIAQPVAMQTVVVFVSVISLPIKVLKLRKSCRTVQRIVSVVRNGHSLTGIFAGFGGNKNNPITGPHTV